MRMAVAESIFVKNARINYGGFTPYQWVFGKLPIEITSLSTEATMDALGAQEDVYSGESPFSQ